MATERNKTVVQDGPGIVRKPGSSSIIQFDTDAIPEVDVTQSDLYNDSNNPRSWLMYGGGYKNQRHVAADHISPDTVNQLQVEWTRNLEEVPYNETIGSGGHDFQGSALIVPGDPPIMYYPQTLDVTRALNARTGDLLWTHQYNPASPLAESVPPSRGLAVLGDTIYRTTLDLGVLAIDRFTGEERWYYNGAYEYRGEQAEGDPQTALHEELVFDRGRGVTSSFAPIIYEGTLMKGSFGGEFGVSGWIDGINLDGERSWRFNTTPPDQWVGDSWIHGGSTVWQACAVEPEEGTAVFPTANPGPWYGTVRPGWNQYTCGKVALDPETGEYQWHYQESPHDWWDYDSPSPALIYDAEVYGEQRRLTSWSGKTGWIFTTDVQDGKLVQRSQEFVDHVNMWDLPPIGGNMEADWIAPEVRGGTDPQPPSIDPERRVLITKGTNVPFKLTYETVEYQPGESYTGIDDFIRPAPNQEVEGWNGMTGNISAIDPVSGEVLWQDWFPNTTAWGGSMTTAGGVAFAGASTGELFAYDTETGDKLWRYGFDDGCDGAPVSWVDPQEGKQYVAVGAAGSEVETREGGTLAAFSVDMQ